MKLLLNCFLSLGSDLGVAPLSDALPAEEVSTGGGGRVSSLLQTQNTAGDSGTRAVAALRTADTKSSRQQHMLQ